MIPSPMDEKALERALHSELANRIAEVSSYPDEKFGVLKAGEIIGVFIVCVILPILIVVLTR